MAALSSTAPMEPAPLVITRVRMVTAIITMVGSSRKKMFCSVFCGGAAGGMISTGVSSKRVSCRVLILYSGKATPSPFSGEKAGITAEALISNER